MIYQKTTYTLWEGEKKEFGSSEIMLEYYFWMEQILLYIIGPRLLALMVSRCQLQMMMETKPWKTTGRLRVRETVWKQQSGKIIKWNILFAIAWNTWNKTSFIILVFSVSGNRNQLWLSHVGKEFVGREIDYLLDSVRRWENQWGT